MPAFAPSFLDRDTPCSEILQKGTEMSVERCAEAVRRVLRAECGKELSREEAAKAARVVLDVVRDPPQTVLHTICEVNCNRSACSIARQCQGKDLQCYRQRLEMVVSAFLVADEAEEDLLEEFRQWDA